MRKRQDNTEAAKLRQQGTGGPGKRSSSKKEFEELNARLAAIVESSDDAIIGKDLNGIITSWNKGAEKTYGYAAEEVIGQPISMLVPPTHTDEIPRMLEKIRNGENIGHFETVRVRKDGAVINISLSLAPIKNGSGAIVGASTIARDITRNRRVELALQESEEKLRLFLEYSPVYVFFKDDKIRAVQLSKNYEKMLGRPIHELLGKTMDDLFPSELAKKMVADDLRILQKGEPLEVEEEFNGHFYSTVKFPIIKEGKPRFLAGFTIDITARKRAEELLKLNENRLEALFKLSRMKISSEKELTDYAIEEAVRLSGSKGGYLHFFSEHQQTIQLCSWSKEVQKTCSSVQTHSYPLESAGIWADSIRLRRAVVHNDYQSLSGTRGCPEGHFRLTRHLGVPIFDGDHIVGATGVGNKEEPYDEADVRQITLFMSSMWGILKQRRAEAAIEHLNSQKELILNSAAEGIFGLDIRGNHMFVNSAAITMLGYEADELTHKHSHSTWHHTKADGSPYPAEECPIHDVLKTGSVIRRRDEVFWRKDGTGFPVSYTSTPITEGGAIVGVVVTFLDITESKFMEEELKRLAVTDKLTGVFNRTKFGEIIEREMEISERYCQPLSIIMLDIDNFKKINDTFGHNAGDYVLKTITHIVQQHIRKVDYFLRWGGEEFIILSSETGPEEESELAERLRKLIEGHKFENVGDVTVSFGVTDFKTGDTEDTFTKRVDDALYKAKKKGRNRVEAI